MEFYANIIYDKNNYYYAIALNGSYLGEVI